MAFVLLALPVSGLSLVVTATASAATPGSVMCQKFKGSLSGSTGKIGKCNDHADTGAKGTFPITMLETTSGTITWNGTGTTTLDDVIMTPYESIGTCASGSTELSVSGDVNGGTGNALKAIPSGETMSALVCLTTSLTVSLAPYSSVDFIPAA